MNEYDEHFLDLITTWAVLTEQVLAMEGGDAGVLEWYFDDAKRAAADNARWSQEDRVTARIAARSGAMAEQVFEADFYDASRHRRRTRPDDSGLPDPGLPEGS